MTNAAWWARVVQTRTRHDDLLPQRVWTLRKGTREATIDLRAVAGLGAEIVLTVNGELRRLACHTTNWQRFVFVEIRAPQPEHVRVAVENGPRLRFTPVKR